MMDKFEDVLNGFLHIENLDTYVTGSNSRFLSSDIVTEFRGRSDEIRIHPLSFEEFYSAKKWNWNDAWREYSTFGGLPYILSLKTRDEKIKYLKKLEKETYLRDLIERNKIKNDAEFEELLSILASAIGSPTNPLKLQNSFKSLKNINITSPTIKKFLDYIQDAFIISKSMRYDVKGKKYINTPSKYYFTDIGLRNSILDFRQQEMSHIMENVIYNELLLRGFSVDVGAIDVLEKNNASYKKITTEIDFVASKGDLKYYIQSAYSIPDEQKREQEIRPLRNAKDSFKKVVITYDDINPYFDENGIFTIGLKDFLLNENSLEYSA